jgi:hypothetical protein
VWVGVGGGKTKSWSMGREHTVKVRSA